MCYLFVNNKIMKKIIILLSLGLLFTSCVTEEPTSIQDKPNKVESELSIVSEGRACVQTSIVSEPGLDTYTSVTCMSTNSLSEDNFKSLCEIGYQLEWIELDVEYLKECPGPYYGICKNAAPEQSREALWGNWDVYYYDSKDVVTDGSWNPFCDDFEKWIL